MLFHTTIIQTIASGCCDFLAQFILVRINHFVPASVICFIDVNIQKIYRCWIVWGKDIRVAIIPSILAVAYLGQHHPIFI